MTEPDDIDTDARGMRDAMLSVCDALETNAEVYLFTDADRDVLFEAIGNIRDVANDMDATHNPTPPGPPDPMDLAKDRRMGDA